MLFLIPLLSALSFAQPQSDVVATDQPTLGNRIARIAERYVKKKPSLTMESCNGLIQDVTQEAGHPVKGSVSHLWTRMKEQGWTHRRARPSPGDLVFFDKTYDKNRNGRQDDRLTHIGLVISVDPDATIHIAHRAISGIRPLTMNLNTPSAHKVDDKLTNSFLAKRGFGKEGSKLAGELFAGFATLGGRSPAVERPPHKRIRHAIQVPDSSLPPSAMLIAAGRRLPKSDLAAVSCQQLSLLRSTIFARHGYSFESASLRKVFHTESWYRKNTAVKSATIDALLSKRDYRQLRRIQRKERRCVRKR